MILKKLQNHLDAMQQAPNTMFGFRTHLGTQDVLMQLKEKILAPATRHSPMAILTLDLKGAFYNVALEAILRNVIPTQDAGRGPTATLLIFFPTVEP